MCATGDLVGRRITRLVLKVRAHVAAAPASQ